MWLIAVERLRETDYGRGGERQRRGPMALTAEELLANFLTASMAPVTKLVADAACQTSASAARRGRVAAKVWRGRRWGWCHTRG